MIISIITPTTGKKSLYRLINSIRNQKVSYEHILLWDDKREDDFYRLNKEIDAKSPYDMEDNNTYSLVLKGNCVLGQASGSALRAVGLMAAKGDYVAFADDDVWYDDDHFRNILPLLDSKEWAYCRRKIYGQNKGYIGIDNFESVGNSLDRKVPYEMVDNNCMIFNRRFGVSGACLYRETREYNDDRLFYSFLKQYAGEPGVTLKPTVNQICPERLEPMFMKYCSAER